MLFAKPTFRYRKLDRKHTLKEGVSQVLAMD